MRSFGQPSFSGEQATKPAAQAFAPLGAMPMLASSLSCDQFLALNPGDAYFRTGIQFYSTIANCLVATAPRNKLAAYAVASPNPAAGNGSNTRRGLDWLFPYIAYKFLGQIGCNTWVALGSVTSVAGVPNAQAAAIQRYWSQFRISALSTGDIANITSIANFICSYLTPKVPGVLMLRPALGVLGPATISLPSFNLPSLNPAGAVRDAFGGVMKQVGAMFGQPVTHAGDTRPAGQALGDSPITTILVTAGVMAVLGFFWFSSNEETKAIAARRASNR